MLYLVDGGGANLSGDGFANSVDFVWGGRLFRNQVVMSAKHIPQLGCAFGNCTAGAAYTAALCDELVMVKNNATIYLGGPPLVKAATGEDADEQTLGGALMHCSKSGVADHYVDTEEQACRKMRAMVEHLPTMQSFNSRPAIFNNTGLGSPHFATQGEVDPPLFPADELYGVLPEDNKIPFDIREVIARVVDGSRFHEFKAR